MTNLLTLDRLANWVQRDVGEVYADPLAADVVDQVSRLACFVGGHDGVTVGPAGTVLPEWSLDGAGGTEVAPIDVQTVVLKVCKRSYQNPDAVVAEGGMGPLGGERYADTQALFMEFTEEERKIVARYHPNGDPLGGATVSVISTTLGSDATLPQSAVLYLASDDQVNLHLAADPRSWDIPMFSPGDPGDPGNYDEGM